MQGLEQLPRILLSRTPVTMALVPQLPHFEATSSAGGLVMDHWALLMMKDPELQLLQETPLPSITRRKHHARSPETYMLGRLLLVLLLRGGLTASGIHRSRALSAGVRGTFRCLGGGGGILHPGSRHLRFRPRGCRGRHRGGGRGCGRRCRGGHLLAGALPQAVSSSPRQALGGYQSAAFPSPFQALDGTYALQPLEV